MISLEWCNEYVDISDLDPKELAVKITTAGTNIEKVYTNANPLLVIGYVKECVPHPDSDHMKICQVDVGKETIQIVCGASNVDAGEKVIVALPGCVLPGDFKIEKAMKRGVESNGMICALMEIGLEEATPENHAKGIYVLDKDAPVGENAIKYMNREVTTYELDIHKHRNNDCYYHIGFAYEIASIINRKVKLPESNYKTDKSDNVNKHVKLKVDTEMCPYYSCKMVKNVKIGESPLFIKKRLVDAGMRSINNVVDISNYVMLEFGNPLHFFDKDKLGDTILVRQAIDGEKIVTLDEKERTLSSKDIVITDGKKPVCIAGVMGGENTEVDDNTKDILIESAIFDAVSIRNTAKNLDLRSEASIRYGKGLSYEYTKMALDRACYLLEKYASGTVIDGEIVHDKTDKTPNIVKFKAKDVCDLLGLEISTDDMKKELDRLDFPYELSKDVFTVTIPRRRLDIEANVNDIAEEIGRLYGYENLASTLPVVNNRRGMYKGDVQIRKSITRRLRSLGLTEVKTYTLVNPDDASKFKYESKNQIVLPNPMSVDKSVIRTTLIPSLLATYEYNKARKVSDINIYEIAKTYDKDYNEDVKVCILMSGNYISNSWSHNNIKNDFYSIKGVVCNLLDYLGLHNRYQFEVNKEACGFHPGICATITLDKQPVGIIGRVHPGIAKDDIYVCELSMTKIDVKSRKVKFKEGFKYPEITKDMAFIIDRGVPCEDIISIIRKAGGKLLQNIEVFDLYEGDKIDKDKKSIAFSLTFNAIDRTLSDEEVMEVFNKIISEVTSKLNAELRDK